MRTLVSRVFVSSTIKLTPDVGYIQITHGLMAIVSVPVFTAGEVVSKMVLDHNQGEDCLKVKNNVRL